MEAAFDIKSTVENNLLEGMKLAYPDLNVEIASAASYPGEPFASVHVSIKNPGFVGEDIPSKMFLMVDIFYVDDHRVSSRTLDCLRAESQISQPYVLFLNAAFSGDDSHKIYNPACAESRLFEMKQDDQTLAFVSVHHGTNQLPEMKFFSRFDGYKSVELCILRDLDACYRRAIVQKVGSVDFVSRKYRNFEVRLWSQDKARSLLTTFSIFPVDDGFVDVAAIRAALNKELPVDPKYAKFFQSEWSEVGEVHKNYNPFFNSSRYFGITNAGKVALVSMSVEPKSLNSLLSSTNADDRRFIRDLFKCPSMPRFKDTAAAQQLFHCPVFVEENTYSSRVSYPISTPFVSLLDGLGERPVQELIDFEKGQVEARERFTITCLGKHGAITADEVNFKDILQAFESTVKSSSGFYNCSLGLEGLECPKLSLEWSSFPGWKRVVPVGDLYVAISGSHFALNTSLSSDAQIVAAFEEIKGDCPAVLFSVYSKDGYGPGGIYGTFYILVTKDAKA